MRHETARAPWWLVHVNFPPDFADPQRGDGSEVTPSNSSARRSHLAVSADSVMPLRGPSGPAVPVIRLLHAEGLPLPLYETARAAGMDLRAAVPEGEPLTLRPGAWFAVPTGLAMALPEGFEGQIRPRSGLAFKYGVTCLNSPGTIDADYRGEVKVILINHGPEDFVICRGERIGQLVVAPVVQAQWVEVDRLDDTARGSGGFGSTGRS